MPILTYLDTGVFIAASVGTDPLSSSAFSYLQDPNRFLLTSDYVELELLTMPVYFRNERQLRFYKSALALTTRVPNSDALVKLALDESKKIGCAAIDALHLAAAALAKADDFITSEKPTKPMFRTMLVKVISLAGAP